MRKADRLLVGTDRDEVTSVCPSPHRKGRHGLICAPDACEVASYLKEHVAPGSRRKRRPTLKVDRCCG